MRSWSSPSRIASAAPRAIRSSGVPRPGKIATRPGCWRASRRARSIVSGSPRGTMIVAMSNGARRSMPARMASAPPSRCSGPVVSSNVRGPSASEQRRAIARLHSALPDSALALKCAASAGSRQDRWAGRRQPKRTAIDRFVRRARRQPGIAFGRARGAGAGRDDRVAAQAAERDQRMRRRFVTQQQRAEQLGLGGAATGPGGRSATRTAGPRRMSRTARPRQAHPNRWSLRG